MHLVLLVTSLFAAAKISAVVLIEQPFKEALSKRQTLSKDALQVDLGYGIYQGLSDTAVGINTWKGIRFAAPPTGARRWQRPEAPAVNRTSVTSATDFGAMCSQVGYSGISMEIDPRGTEDCLFLNVQSPTNATNLPVLVWIHGGGYGTGNGQQDFTDMMKITGNTFVVVSIQYRLGPFGFLASDEVVTKGVANAGLLDQFFALQWVQTYISQFGGDPSAVTISGESAGAGAALLHDIAYGGSMGDSLFRSTIAASPFLPRQYAYNDQAPTQAYYSLASQAGCPLGAYGNRNETLFECLVSKDTATLRDAAIAVTNTGSYGTWAFLPVTDGVFLQGAPSKQLLEKRVNGRNVLVGNNANEGPLFTPQNITSEALLLDRLRSILPEFSDNDLTNVLLHYPIADDTNNVKFATTGTSRPSALDQSGLATGQQQRANNIYAELTFVCPSYWMAEAFASRGRTAYKYQYSVAPGTHGIDTLGYFGPYGSVAFLSEDFQRAFMNIWGNFVTRENPSITDSLFTGSSNSSTRLGADPSIQWPLFSASTSYQQLNLNQTGGVPTVGSFEVSSPVNTTYLVGPGLQNNFGFVDAYTWEDGRGARCEFWRSTAKLIPA
ncbi:acetylcholinesterase precursor [Boeremia exigua]|uniref:acetylcholinesterase precursor n=1 Tax=Boeremia exigua TaxID=749465 RepID=UPI001E8DD9FF|nr:acetylcholinesterase precursor [Boeremia exigua]KAH6628963.1 acetylcholinesterase precursor [Boeremia exigua]